MDDAQVIDRLRAALDEVTAGIDDDTGHLDEIALDTIDVRDTRDGRPRRSAWLAAAAATLLLAGGATWALSTRTHDPAASPEGDSPTTSIRPAEPGRDAPRFTLPPDEFIEGMVTAGQPFGFDDPGAPAISWRIEGDGMDGFLYATIGDTPYEATADDQVDALSPPTGTARLVWAPASSVGVVVPFVEWTQPDGSIWTFHSIGLYSAVSSNNWIDLVFAAEPGSGLPIVLPDPRASVLAVGSTLTWMSSEVFTPADGSTESVSITVADGADAIGRLPATGDARATTVDGAPAWQAQADDGRTTVVWDAGGGWWGIVEISAGLADRADELIGSISRVPTDQRYAVDARVEEQDGFDTIVLPLDLPFAAAYQLRGFSWDSVTSELTPDGRRTTGPLRLVVRLSGTTFELVDVRGAAPTPEVAPVCDTYPSELDEIMAPLQTLRGPQLAGLGLVSWGMVDTGGDSCDRLTVAALTDSPALHDALGPLEDRMTIRSVLTPVE